MNTLFPYPLRIPSFTDFYDHIMSSQQNASMSSPCSSSPSTLLSNPGSMLTTANTTNTTTTFAGTLIPTPTPTSTTSLPSPYNLAVEIFNSLALHQHQQQHHQHQLSMDEKTLSRLQTQSSAPSPTTLQNLSLQLLNMTNSSLNTLPNSCNDLSSHSMHQLRSNTHWNSKHTTANNNSNLPLLSSSSPSSSVISTETSSTSSLSTACQHSRVACNHVEDLSSLQQDNNNNNNAILNTYESLASWSSALSTASPSAVAAFQHALGQLALLGLSSPSPTHNDRMESNTTPCSSESINLSKEQSNYKLLKNNSNNNNHFKGQDCDFPTTMHNSTVVNQATMYKKSEEGSKIIIRQTADADEHFFKALRGLKVDVSTDFNSSDLQKQPTFAEVYNKPSTLSSQTKSSFHRCDSSQETFKEDGQQMDEEKEKEKTKAKAKKHQHQHQHHHEQQQQRSAAEMAVDEHFEKSLAAFRASTSLKKSTNHLLHNNNDHAKSKLELSHSIENTSINVSINSDLYSQNDKSSMAVNTPPKVQHKSLQTVPRGERYAVNSLLHYNTSKPTSNPNLTTTTSFDNTQFYPLTTSSASHRSSRQSTNFIEINDENGVVSVSSLSSSSPSSSSSSSTSSQVHSPPVTINRFKLKFASSSTSLPPLFPINSFKPKKNWLAQYDWRYQQSETTNQSPTTPNTNQSIFDSFASSPSTSSVNITTGESVEEDVQQQISNLSMPKLHIISELCNTLTTSNNTRDNNNSNSNNNNNNDANDGDNDEEETNNDELSTEEAPDIRNNQDYTFDYTANEHCDTDNDNNADKQHVVNTLTKTSFVKNSLNEQKDDYKKESNEELIIYEDNFKSEFFKERNKNTEDTSNNMNNNRSNRCKHNFNWSLSASISSSPTFHDDHNDQSSEDHHHHHHSTGDYFDHGSTYSLDSTIIMNSGSIQQTNDTRAMNITQNNMNSSNMNTIHQTDRIKDEENNKCSSVQQFQSYQNYDHHTSHPHQQHQHHPYQHHHHQQQHQHQQQKFINEINDKFDSDEILHNSWSLRKRVSSEVSPWSTLKRSRSVLTSPSLHSDQCSVNIASSNEFSFDEVMNEEYEMHNSNANSNSNNNNNSNSNANERGFVHSKSMDSTLNPFDDSTTTTNNNNNNNLRLSKCNLSNDNENLSEQKKTQSEPNVPKSGDNNIKEEEKPLINSTSSYPSFRQLEKTSSPSSSSS
ncbi:unnamed protein product [Trichobilharzia szidati]|nr:unnamed protein product [Trichobilharzia szidati]